MIAINVINLGLGILCVLWSINWWRKNHGAELYAAPVIIYALHNILFSVVTTVLKIIECNTLPDNFLASWTSGLCLHGLFTVVILVFSLQRIRKRGI
jgi:hypothetical protein